MNNDLISRSELLGMERLLWCKPYENSKEARNLYEQMMYDIENIPAAMTIPKDFAVKTFEKSVVDDTDVVVIWFDENVTTSENIRYVGLVPLGLKTKSSMKFDFTSPP